MKFEVRLNNKTVAETDDVQIAGTAFQRAMEKGATVQAAHAVAEFLMHDENKMIRVTQELLDMPEAFKRTPEKLNG